MGAPRSRRAAADAELSGELGVAGGGKYRGFLMTDGDPFDLANLKENIRAVYSGGAKVR